MAESIQITRHRVSGMDCASCANKIETALRRMPSVADVNASVSGGTVTVRHGNDVTGADLAAQVTKLGYTVVGLADGLTEERSGILREDRREHKSGAQATPQRNARERGAREKPWWQTKKGLLAIASGVALIAAYGIGYAFPPFERWAFLTAVVAGLIPIARRALASARFGTPFSIEMLMTIAAVGAVFIGATEEAAVVVFLFLVGELLEGVAVGRARASIEGLSALVPKSALVVENDQTREVPADALQIGATILVRPGDRIAGDGVIVEGESEINEAPVTGESMPKRKQAADSIFAGTVNGGGALRIRVTATAADNTIARIIKLVEEAQERKAPTERFINRFSRYYTPAVVAVAAIVAVVPPLLFGASWDEWIYKGLAILLIGCPCALVISTPAAIAAGLSAGARRGLLLKGGAVLESLGKITTAALDKTGTLTEGKPKVTDVIAFGRTEGDVLSLAGALEAGSNHPLATAILDRAKAESVPVPPALDASAVPGKGVTGKVKDLLLFLGSPRAAAARASLTTEQIKRIEVLNGESKTVSVLLADNQVAGIIAMRDEPRADAIAGLGALTAAGIKTLMLTGDNKETAHAIGRKLGIDARGELLPEDKQRIVGELQKRGEVVAKVGDGINDAPALASADVGIAMGGGTDVALETADAAILHGRVLDIARLVELSKATMSNIHQNITIALGLKAAFLITTILGLTGLWPAILADTGATVLVTANAVRLLAWRGN